jgi:TetR/AcrR family transcriptional regulator, regulator of autoinduction and epiphytic fitness
MVSAVVIPPESSKATSAPIPRPSFKQQMLQAREDAIVETVNRLLAEKGFDLMTVDEVAAEVGIAKASLYKHFPSKEDLATAAMVRALERAHAFLDSLPADAPPAEQLKAVARWSLELQLAGEMPILPSENSSLRATLMASRPYVDSLIRVSDRMGAWIEAAQASGSINPKLPAILILYTLYARACDPVPQFLKASGQFSDEQIVEMVLDTCFNGLL